MRKYRIKSFLNHRRIFLFWWVASLGIAAPWLVTAGGGNERSPQSDLQACTVMNVYDGDTITAKCDGKRQKIRLYCIDAPEMGQRPWGKESRDYLREKIPRGTEVEMVSHGKDRYGRLIAEILVDGRNKNLEMVETGNAVEYQAYCDDSRFIEAQRTATQSSLGVWSKSGDQQRPWEWRR
jgi:endonuclease YncB( thermonuclease family)